MSYDENDAAYDQWMEDLYKEHKEEAIAEFTTERLQSYYLAHPTLAAASRDALLKARRLDEHEFFDAALVFAQIATETCLKAVVLKPFVHGLVHSNSTANFVSDLALSHVGLDRFRKLLFRLILDHAKLDLGQFKRDGSTETLWVEVDRIQSIRNGVIHRAEEVSSSGAKLGIAVAHSMLNEVFPAAVAGVGLHVHDGIRVCGQYFCKYEGVLSERLMAKLRGEEN